MRQVAFAILTTFFILISCSIVNNERNNENNVNIEKENHSIATVEKETINIVESVECASTLRETTISWKDLINQMNKEVENIPYNFNDMNQKQQWFLAYKDVISKYPKELHMLTIYEVYSEEDLELLYGVVQAEVGDEYSFVEKINVVSVMFNRLNSGNYSSLKEVLTAPYQFAGIVNGKQIDEKTILACEYVFLFGDTTDGCKGFRSDIAPEEWYSWSYQFSDEAHHFYK